MPRRKNRSSKKKRVIRNSEKVSNPSDVALRYNGPIVPPDTRFQLASVMEVLHGAFPVSGDVAGLVAGNINTGNPSGAPTWANLASRYDEFRVLASKIKYVPVDRYDSPLAVTTAVNLPVIYFAFDRDSSSTPGSTSAAISYASCDAYGLADPFSRSWKMLGSDEAAWITTAGPSASKARGFVWISQGNSATPSMTYGYFFVTYLVQFRGGT